jgi:hypothetical protein
MADIKSPDRHNIFELLSMGWATLTRTIATAPSPGRCSSVLSTGHFGDQSSVISNFFEMIGTN